MATFRNAEYSESSSTPQADYIPAVMGVADGDIVFHLSAWADAGGGIPTSMGWYDGSPHPTTPPGWTVLIDELVGTTWFFGAYKIAGPSEVNQTFLAYVGASPAYLVGNAKSTAVFAVYYDYDNAIDAENHQSSVSAVPADAPSLTPSRTASRLITFHAVNADPVVGIFSMSTPAGATLRVDTGGTGPPGNDPLAICLSDRAIVGTSPTGTATSTPSAGSAGPRFGWSILLPSGPPPPSSPCPPIESIDSDASNPSEGVFDYSGFAVGDFMLLVHQRPIGTGPLTVPDGWTEIWSQDDPVGGPGTWGGLWYAAYRFADGITTTVDVGLTNRTALRGYRNVDTIEPIAWLLIDAEGSGNPNSRAGSAAVDIVLYGGTTIFTFDEPADMTLRNADTYGDGTGIGWADAAPAPNPDPVDPGFPDYWSTPYFNFGAYRHWSRESGTNNIPGPRKQLSLVLQPYAPPANDDWANTEVLTGDSGVVTGSVVCATLELGEDDTWSGTNSIWYSYTPATDGTLTVGTDGSNFDTVLGIYVGGFAAVDVVIQDDDGGPGARSLITDFPVAGGTTYHIRVNSFSGLSIPGEGNVVLTWGFTAAPPMNTVWYGWTPTQAGSLTLSLDPNGLWMILEVFTGDSLATLVGPIAQQVTYTVHPITFPVDAYETYWFRVRNDDGSSGMPPPLDGPGPFTLTWAFARILAPRKTSPSRGRLGCGELGAFITSRCGAPRLCQLTDASQITWDRRLDDISEAQVIVPTGGSIDSDCCECLAAIEPWCHELHIFRNGVFVWAGPVVAVTYGYEQVTIDARDLLAWTQFRIPEINLDYQTVGADISEIGKEVLRLAFADDDPCAAAYIQARPTEYPDTHLEVLRCFEGTAYDQLSGLAEEGLNFTVLGRSIILGGEALPTRAIGILTDEMILGDIEVTKNGLLAGNRYYVTYDGFDDPAQCLAQGVDTTCTGCPCSCPAVSDPVDEVCYGTLEKLHDIGELGNYATAKQLADSLAAATKLVPRTIEFNSGTRISPDVPWGINDMVPGGRIDVTLTGLCLPIYQSFRILEVSSTQEGLNEEEVSLTLGTIATDTGEIG